MLPRHGIVHWPEGRASYLLFQPCSAQRHWNPAGPGTERLDDAQLSPDRLTVRRSANKGSDMFMHMHSNSNMTCPVACKQGLSGGTQLERKEAVALAKRVALLWFHLHAAAHEYRQVPAKPLAATGAGTADWCTLHTVHHSSSASSRRPIHS